MRSWVTLPLVTRVLALAPLSLPLAVAGGGGCGREIGNECTTSQECSQAGDRQCDVTQPGGYCTIEGCDDTTCSEEAVCVRFFPVAYLSRPCEPSTEDLPPGGEGGAASTNECRETELCLSEGLCAPGESERRFCMKRCEGDDECRDGYVCRATGTAGAELIPRAPFEPPPVARFCAASL